jgi:A/G-specific adenine glycosylase
MEKEDIQTTLIPWFMQNKRKLPWRDVDNWYYTWISEVMLQQTQVDQVIPYFKRFIDRFGDVNQLAEASEQQVLKVWEGLGYYSRARNLHRSAKIIVDKYQSKIPTNVAELQQLPGLGPYITNAVLSIAFNKPVAVVDGNVKRVITRLYALKEDIRKQATHLKIQKLMDSIIPFDQSAIFNEAMMELGAVICQPTKPLCFKCPLHPHCKARQKGLINNIPYRSKKKKVPVRKAVAFIIRCDKEYLLGKRPPDSMLAGMWEFPTVFLKNGNSIKCAENTVVQKITPDYSNHITHWSPVNHTYTHFRLILYSRYITTQSRDISLSGYSELRWYTFNGLKKLPIHKAIWKLLEKAEYDLIVESN